MKIPGKPDPAPRQRFEALLQEARAAAKPPCSEGAVPPMPDGFSARVTAATRKHAAARSAAWQGACTAGALLAIAAASVAEWRDRSDARKELASALLQLDDGLSDPFYLFDQ